MYLHLKQRLRRHFREFLRRAYDLDFPRITIEEPPRVELGEYALPLAFELAKTLRKPPRQIAQEIIKGSGPLAGFEQFDVAGGGYINSRVNRGAMASALTADQRPDRDVTAGKVIVEHTSINPNKAAHIGHLRNAILGDTFVRLLKFAGKEVDVQNYIDNTGVQVADIIVGFLQIEKKSRAEIEQLILMPRFDFCCWDLYARVSQWYAQDKEKLQFRSQALHDMERGGNETSAIAETISAAISRLHLQTMERLSITYDLLPRESEILRLHFWDAAFEKLKSAGVLFYENQGKNRGCWVMRRAGTAKNNALQVESATDATASEVSEEDQKVIVRSNGTVGYVGKDIAYHMWKFGLLGKDFEYQPFYRYDGGKDCWISTVNGVPDHPHFGGVAEIFNVIDARQAEAQSTVIEALRGMGAQEQANHYTHFSYEMVALTPRCAAELGYQLSEEDKGRAYVEVSGRRGFGVKADDLIDVLVATAKKEVDSRNLQLGEDDRMSIAVQIAVGALRYFMLKFTKSSLIAFDFKEALAFEGETGPYAQYAVVRASNIFRKAGIDPDGRTTWAEGLDFGKYLDDESANPIWELWLAASKTSYVVEQCIATTEPAYLAKHVFELAQLFNTFYHRHPVLAEPDEDRKKFLLATTAVVRRELIRALGIMGITAPAVM